MSTSVETESVEETRALGRRLGAALEAGDVIGLEGDLGTGKTELVKGIAEALGVTAKRAHRQVFAAKPAGLPADLAIYRLKPARETARDLSGLDSPDDESPQA